MSDKEPDTDSKPIAESENPETTVTEPANPPEPVAQTAEPTETPESEPATEPENNQSSQPPSSNPDTDKSAQPTEDDSLKIETAPQPETERKSSTDQKEKDAADGKEVNDDLQNIIKELDDPKTEKSKQPDEKDGGKQTTENLLSVLEDGLETQPKSRPGPASSKIPKDSSKASTSSESVPKPSKPKKYLYKLKSKTGKILHYTSTVPITLKRPVIHLTKMQDPRLATAAQKVIEGDKDEVDSDNSFKENNLKENEAPNVIKKKGRPSILSKVTPVTSKISPESPQKIPPVITLDGNNSDTGDDFKNKSTPSFSMQTRKRQLKFLPDGRLITPQKRIKSDDKKNSTSSDSDLDIISSEGEAVDASGIKEVKKIEPPQQIVKKFKPEVKLNNSVGERRKYKKVFDFESYYREKTGAPPPPSIVRQGGPQLTPIRKYVDTPRPKVLGPSTSTPKKASSVDPAQLLSSLIGVPILPNQLNVVKFKPKIIQERTNNVVPTTPKKVTFEDDKKKFATTNQSELLKSTPFKIVSKPTYQKILPKPSGVEPIVQNRMAFQPVVVDNKYTTVPANSIFTAGPPYLRESLGETLSKFETFSDSKVVKTKEGPKKAVKRKHPEEGSLKDTVPKTIYDLMYEIFDKLPSWNLHVIPDTNCFCIAQVSRGRMGIPTLKKSIELNSEFFAKVYVHQLHCKRYDGIYDTENKLIKLIKEVDALAA